MPKAVVSNPLQQDINIVANNNNKNSLTQPLGRFTIDQVLLHMNTQEIKNYKNANKLDQEKMLREEVRQMERELSGSNGGIKN